MYNDVWGCAEILPIFLFQKMSTDDNCLKKDYRSRQDSNLRGETPMDF